MTHTTAASAGPASATASSPSSSSRAFIPAEVRGAVERYLASRVRDEGLREDIAQETFIRAFRFLPSLSSPESLKPWLFQIARNQAATAIRREARRPEVLCGFAADLGDGSSDGATGGFVAAGTAPESPRRAAERSELMSALAEALDGLPARQREAFELFALEDLTLAQAAEAMGCSAGAVKFHVHAARKKLRERLAEHLAA